jgi:hypothetical protein
MIVSEIINSINEFMEKEEMIYEYDEEKLRYNFGFNLDNAVVLHVDCVLGIDADGEDILVAGYPEIRLKEETRHELEAFLFGIDCRGFRGIWQIDGEDLRYLRCVPLDGNASITYEILDAAVFSIPYIVTKYIDSIVAIVLGYTTAKKELEKFFPEEEGESDESDSDETGGTSCEDAADSHNSFSETAADDTGSDSAAKVFDTMFLWIKGDQQNEE